MKTEIAANVGKHAFEVAGLGRAPFRFVGMRENVINHADGTSQAGGCCDYCFTGIRYECHIQSADGQHHKVGSNCIAKVGDEGLLKAFKTSPEYRKHQRKLASDKAAKVHAEAQQIIADKADKLASLPHPRGFVDRETKLPLTALDQAKWDLQNCGASGMKGTLAWLKRITQ